MSIDWAKIDVGLVDWASQHWCLRCGETCTGPDNLCEPTCHFPTPRIWCKSCYEQRPVWSAARSLKFCGPCWLAKYGPLNARARGLTVRLTGVGDEAPLTLGQIGVDKETEGLGGSLTLYWEET